MDARRSRVFPDEERALSYAARGPGNFLYREPDELYRSPAESHCLTTRSLVVQKFFLSLGRSYLSGQRGHDSITAFWKDTPTLNGANIWDEQKVVSPPEELASQVTSVLMRGLAQALPAFPLK
jgi:hypothetical protein